jgi:hypothetical protein
MPSGEAMQIKTTSGSGSAGLGIVGTGLALALPRAEWIGWLLVVAGLFVFAFDVRIERGHVEVGSPQSLRKRLKRMWPQYLMVLSGAVFFVGLVGFLQLNVTPPPQKDTGIEGPPPDASRIVVSKFIFTPTDAAKLELGYEIDLHMINRGKIHGYAPLLHFAFKSSEALLPKEEIDKEIAGVLALARLPPADHTREQIEVGVDQYSRLPVGLSREAYLDITNGKTAFYLFVALTYRDDSLPPGRYWISEFCAFQTKDLIPSFQLCRGHNGVRLNPS